MRAAGYTASLLRKRRAQPEPAEDTAIWDPPAAQMSSVADLSQQQQQQQQQQQPISQQQWEPVRSAGSQLDAGPASTSQPQRESSVQAAPRWRRQYIFCAATMPAGDGAKTKSIKKVRVLCCA